MTSRADGTATIRFVALVAFLLMGVGTAAAQTGTPGERQLAYCWTELEAGESARAITSANSALRLDPSLYEAMVCKASAFAEDGHIERARSLLGAYVEVRLGLTPSDRALALMTRLGLNPDGTPAPEPNSEAAVATSPQKGLPPAGLTGIVIGSAGGALAGIGGAMHGVSWTDAQPGASGQFEGTVGEFDQLLGVNRGGLGLLVTGASALGAGVAVALVGLTQDGPKAAAVVVPMPDGGFAVSIGGRW